MAQEHNISQQELVQKRRDWNVHIAGWQTSRLSKTEYCQINPIRGALVKSGVTALVVVKADPACRPLANIQNL